VPHFPPVTRFLMMACTAMFFIDLLVPVGGILALWPLESGNFLPWQVVTYAFMHGHGDFGHLFFNMLALWMFGSEMEMLWGPRRYVQYVTASILAAAAAQLLITALSGPPYYPTVGFSGAVFGLLLAYGMMFPNRTVVLLIPPMPMKAKTLVVVYGVLELVLGVYGGAGIAHFAHLGGMLGGWLMIRYWRGQAPFGRRR
jgi:membrane associated rhomboid family serine protease